MFVESAVERRAAEAERIRRLADVAAMVAKALFDHRLLDRLADDVLPLAGLVVGLGPGELQHVGEESLGETVTADDLLGRALWLLASEPT